MSGEHDRPRVGCGAAIVRDGTLLLVRRRRDPESGFWGLPGGKVDLFEPVQAAMSREIFEELGIDVQASTLLCVIDQIDRRAGQHWVAPVYLVEQFRGTPTVREPEALSEMGWFHLDNLPTPLTEATRQALPHLWPTQV
jgi:ADP-ribose pyrophosphatase YjhB (NUDIX family)